MSTLFISDLHLTPKRPESTEYFIDFMREKTKLAKVIYVLGDLFEYWIGDDASSQLVADPVIDQFKRLADADVSLFFMPGNRDFLVGKEFCTQAGFKYLHDESLVTLNDQQVLLLHGDTLCTDDIEHQGFRDMVNQREWQEQFLNQSIESSSTTSFDFPVHRIQTFFCWCFWSLWLRGFLRYGNRFES